MSSTFFPHHILWSCATCNMDESLFRAAIEVVPKRADFARMRERFYYRAHGILHSMNC
jgi:hypothetical protein